MDSEPVRYRRATVADARSMFDAMRRGATKPSTPWFQTADNAKSTENRQTVEEAAAKAAQAEQFRQEVNAHVLAHLNRKPQVSAGGTLAEGRSYPMRIGGRHSDEVNAQMNGECSDAGRRLNECKDDGRHSKISSRGMRA